MSDIQAYLENAFKNVQLDKFDKKPEATHYDIEAEMRDLIVRTRIQLELTQKQLAERSGVSQANISKIENGNYKPSVTTLNKIADGLGKRLVVDFIDEEEVV